MSTFNQIFNKNRYDIKSAADNSTKWFAQEVERLRAQRIRSSQLMRGQLNNMKTQVLPGELYMFYYDAKHKDKLPIWDRFPLVFPFRVVPGGFVGLNMHFLPYGVRMALLDKLTEYTTTRSLQEHTRLRLSWATLQRVSLMGEANQSVRRYLYSQVRSPFRKVSAPDWGTAMMLPVQQFITPSGAIVKG